MPPSRGSFRRDLLRKKKFSSKILNLNPTLHNNNYEFVKFMTKFITNTDVRVQYIDHIERKIIDHHGNFKRYSI